jgi:hypothetical protein
VPPTATAFPTLDTQRRMATLVFARKQNRAAYERHKQRELQAWQP